MQVVTDEADVVAEADVAFVLHAPQAVEAHLDSAAPGRPCEVAQRQQLRQKILPASLCCSFRSVTGRASQVILCVSIHSCSGRSSTSSVSSQSNHWRCGMPLQKGLNQRSLS